MKLGRNKMIIIHRHIHRRDALHPPNLTSEQMGTQYVNMKALGPVLQFPHQAGTSAPVTDALFRFCFSFPQQLLTRAWEKKLRTSQMEILSPNRLSLRYERIKYLGSHQRFMGYSHKGQATIFLSSSFLALQKKLYVEEMVSLLIIQQIHSGGKAKDKAGERHSSRKSQLFHGHKLRK